MAELNDLIKQALLEKQTKIIPENIKKGVTAFGVEGSLEQTGTPINNQDKTITENGSYTADEGYTGLGTVTVKTPNGDTKTFETTDAMYADADPIREGKALIYRQSVSYIPKNTAFTQIYFPETIVLPYAVTSEMTASIEITSDWSGSGSTFNITPTDMSTWFSINESYASVAYSSLDGITYTRNYVNVDDWGGGWGGAVAVFEDDVLRIVEDEDYPEGYHMEWTAFTGDETLIREFIRNKGFGYYGLYKYAGVKDETRLQRAKNLKLNTHGSTDKYDFTTDYDSDYDTVFTDIKPVMDLLRTKNSSISSTVLEFLGDNKYRAFNYSYKASNGTTYVSPAMLVHLYGVDTEDVFRFGRYVSIAGTYPATDLGLVVHDIDLNTSTITVTTSNFTTQVQRSGDMQYRYTDYTLDKTHWISRVYYSSNSPSDVEVLYFMSEGSNSGNYDNWNLALSYGKSYEYKPAETQFTLNNSNQLLTGVVALGYDGEYTGEGCEDLVLDNTSSGYFMDNYLGLQPTTNENIYENNLFSSNVTLVKAVYCQSTDVVSEHNISIQKLKTALNNTLSGDIIYFMTMDGTKFAYVDNDEQLIKICNATTLEVLFSTSYLYGNLQITYLNDNLYYMYKDTSNYVYKKLNMNTFELTTIITSYASSYSIDQYNSGTKVSSVKNRYVLCSPYAKNGSTTYRALYVYDTETGYSGTITNYSNTGDTSDMYCCTDESSDNDNLYVFKSYRNTSGDRICYGYRYDLAGHTLTQLYYKNNGAMSWGPSPSVGSAGYVSGNYLYYGSYKANLTNSTVTTVGTEKDIYYSGISEYPYFTRGAGSDITIGEDTVTNYYVKLGKQLILTGDVMSLNESVNHFIPKNIYDQNAYPMKLENDIYYNANTILLPDKYKLGDINGFDIVIFNTKNKLQADAHGVNSYAMVLKNYSLNVNNNYDGTITPTEYDTAVETSQEIKGGN